jgi:hypothetical protein
VEVSDDRWNGDVDDGRVHDDDRPPSAMKGMPSQLRLPGVVVAAIMSSPPYAAEAPAR